MILISVTPFKAADEAYYRHKPNRGEFENYKSQLHKLIEDIKIDGGKTSKNKTGIINAFVRGLEFISVIRNSNYSIFVVRHSNGNIKAIRKQSERN